MPREGLNLFANGDVASQKTDSERGTPRRNFGVVRHGDAAGLDWLDDFFLLGVSFSSERLEPCFPDIAAAFLKASTLLPPLLLAVSMRFRLMALVAARSVEAGAAVAAEAAVAGAGAGAAAVAGAGAAVAATAGEAGATGVAGAAATSLAAVEPEAASVMLEAAVTLETVLEAAVTLETAVPSVDGC